MPLIHLDLVHIYYQILEVMSEEEIVKERWTMPDGEEDDDVFWGFEDLECECDTSSSISPDDSISIRSSKN